MRPAVADRRQLLRVLTAAADLCGLEAAFPERRCGQVHVVIVGAARMAELNQSFLGHSGPTDVLAFDVAPPDPAMLGEPDIVGEIYVCLDVARAALGEYGTSLGEEVVLYAVHGMLHLAGLEDVDEVSRGRMRAREIEVLSALQEKYDLRAIFADSAGSSPPGFEGQS